MYGIGFPELLLFGCFCSVVSDLFHFFQKVYLVLCFLVVCFNYFFLDLSAINNAMSVFAAILTPFLNEVSSFRFRVFSRAV